MRTSSARENPIHLPHNAALVDALPAWILVAALHRDPKGRFRQAASAISRRKARSRRIALAGQSARQYVRRGIGPHLAMTALLLDTADAISASRERASSTPSLEDIRDAAARRLLGTATFAFFPAGATGGPWDAKRSIKSGPTHEPLRRLHEAANLVAGRNTNLTNRQRKCIGALWDAAAPAILATAADDFFEELPASLRRGRDPDELEAQLIRFPVRERREGRRLLPVNATDRPRRDPCA